MPLFDSHTVNLNNIAMTHTRFWSFLMAFFCLSAIAAQDMVTLRNGKNINAKILEINSKSVQFKRTDNLSGPSYNYDICDLDSIKFSNGTVERFAPCEKNNGNIGFNLPANGSVNVNLNTLNRQSMTEQPIDPRSIIYTGLHTFHINNVHVPRQMVREIMRRDNPKAAQEFEKGFANENGGTALCVIGGSTLLGGLIWAAVEAGVSDEESQTISSRREDPNYTGPAVTMGIGALFTLIGLVSDFQARQSYTRAVMMYNDALGFGSPQTQEKEAWSWSFGPAPNGVGLTVKF
jgi:hypothetical protein